MDSLLVSVIIPVYNVVPWLAECLDSVIMQTYSKLEILVIDDGSTDESGTICDEYAGKDQRIKVIHQNHNGLSVARNTGLDLATGEIITFLDADDMMYAYAIERIVTIMEKVSIRILVFGAESYYNGKIISSPKAGIYDRKEILESYVANKGMAGAIWTKVFHASVFQDLRFREGHNYADMPVFLTASVKC